MEHLFFSCGGGVYRALDIPTTKIRPCRFGLILCLGGPVSVAFKSIIKREAAS